MRMVEIDLSQPFEQVLETIRSLPSGCTNAENCRLENDAELKQVIRGLYEAANGRQVETSFGLVAIAPPVAAFLKALPFFVETQIELLIEAATRVIGGPVLFESEIDLVDSLNRNQRSELSKPNSRRQVAKPTLVRASRIPQMIS